MRINLTVKQFQNLREDWVNSKLIFLMSENIVTLDNREFYRQLLFKQFNTEYASNLDFKSSGR